MTKADIIENVYEKVGFSKKESAEIVEMVFDTIKETLEKAEKIKISGFGNFVIRSKKPRDGFVGKIINLNKPFVSHKSLLNLFCVLLTSKQNLAKMSISNDQE